MLVGLVDRIPEQEPKASLPPRRAASDFRRFVRYTRTLGRDEDQFKVKPKYLTIPSRQS